jgi:hypothetical protein
MGPTEVNGVNWPLVSWLERPLADSSLPASLPAAS